MEAEINELLDAAIYKETASEALYLAVGRNASDPGAQALMQELAEQERKHSEWIKALKDKGAAASWHRGRVSDLKISEHLTAPNHLDDAGIQDTLIFAINREQQSVEFYSKMMGALRSQKGKLLCRRLAAEELRHKLKLEIFYDDLFLGED